MGNAITRIYPARYDQERLLCLPVSIMDEQGFREQIQKLAGKDWSLAIVRETTKRSGEQNRYWWGVVVPLIADAIGERSKEDAHRIILAEYYQSQGGYKNPDVKIQSSEMTTVEFMGLIAWTQQWAIEFFGLRIPDPNEMVAK